MYGVEQAKRFLEAILRPFRILGDIHFQMHFFICTRFAQKSPSRNSAGQACPLSRACLLQAGFARRKKEELAPSRQAAKASGSHTERTIISLRLCVFARKKRKNNKARKVGKPPRPPAAKPSGPQFLCVHPPRRTDRPAYRRQVFARRKNVPGVGFSRSGLNFLK
jgi:hypothetical protein